MHKHIVIISILLLPLASAAPAQPLSEKEAKRRDLNAEFDKLGLREQTDFVVEQSDAFLQAPAEPAIEGEFLVAKTPPTVKLQIFTHLEPEYFSGAEQYMACWANWAHVARSDDNRFYMAASDHLAKGCDINVYEYDPAGKGFRRIIDVDELLGWTEDMYTDGKIHGHMGILPDGTLWAATHHGVRPNEEWYESGYRGSWLFSYNPETGEGRNWGVPLIGNSLPCFSVDERRGRLVGTGYKQTMLCWDCHEKRVRFAGYPPHGWTWWGRAMLCDKETGKFWGMDTSEEPHRLMSFDPELNHFERYEVTIPPNPVTGKPGSLRGHTQRPAMDGFYYWTTQNGTFLRFKPETADGPVLETVGVNWDRGRDALQLALSPKGRYVYYQPKGYPAPVVQYDVKTGKKKAIGFLQDVFFEKYGYWLGSQVYGMAASTDGSFLVIVMNGTFSGRKRSFGHPAICVVEIPAGERRE
jgi:hypothetical protein